MIYSRIIMPTNENEAIPKFLINLAFFKIGSWLLQIDDLSSVYISWSLQVDDLSSVYISGVLSDTKTPMVNLKTIDIIYILLF